MNEENRGSATAPQTDNRPPIRGMGPGMGRGGGGGGGGPRGMMPGEKARDFKGTLRTLISYLGARKFPIISVWILAVVSTILSIIGPRVLGGATDELVRGATAKLLGTGSINFDRIAQIILTLITLYLTSTTLSLIQGFLMTGVTTSITYRLRNELDQKIYKLPFSYYDKITHGEVLSRITNDVDTVGQTLNQSMTQIITSITSLISIVVMMLSISWQLTLIALLSIPVSLFFIRFIVQKSQRYYRQQQSYLGKVNGHIEEMFGSHVVIKAFNGEQKSEQTFTEYNDTLYNVGWKSIFLSGLIMPLTGLVGNLSYVVICIVGGNFAATGTMTIGGIQAFIQYVRQFTQPVSQISNISNVLQQAAAAAERVFEFLSEEEEVPEAENAISVKHKKNGSSPDAIEIEGHIEFQNVTFGYHPDQPVINDFSTKIAPGQKIALVGPTGAGKTTIVKLLMRFYDVDSGVITIDGHDIKQFKRNELRSIFGMVLQDTWLFNGTVFDNIRYGNLKATDDEVKQAAKAAQVDHFILTQPGGYNMVINEEASNLSQGQKQLLTIARAILADPDILILDEATSSVDTRTEILIQTAMDNLMKGRTSFIIAHRLSTIKNADLILVINEGDIVEQGTHDELLAKNGFYSDIYMSQFEKVS